MFYPVQKLIASPRALVLGTVMVEISLQTAADEAAIEILMDSAFGAARHSRSVWMLRLLPPVAELSLVLRDGGVLVASLRFREV